MEEPDQNDLTTNQELVEFPNNLEKLNKWVIPSVPRNKIYNFGMFDFKSRMAVKTIEQNVRISKDSQNIFLLCKKDLESFKDYNYMHVGLIQIAIKPLTLLGLNTTIMAYVRDGRCNNFKQSLAAVIETSLCHGPVYFDIAPNLSLSLSDKHLFEALQMNIHTNGYDFKIGSQIMTVCYRIYFKVLNTLNPKAKQISCPGTTTLVQTNLLASKIATNRLIKWEELDFPENWNLPQVVEPEPILNNQVEQIVQTTDGDVEIRFTPQCSFTIPRSISSRYSSNKFYSVPSNMSRASFSEASSSRIKDDSQTVDHINLSEQKIPYGVYEANSSHNERKTSPTESDF
jgi:hypothetical protein